MSRAHAHRYVVALRRAGFLTVEPSTRQLRLSSKIFALEAIARASTPLLGTAARVMDSLCRELNETIILSVWDGGCPTVVRVADFSDRMLRVSVPVGAKLGLDSAQAAIFVSHRDSQCPVQLAVNSPAHDGVRCIAAPVLVFGELIAAIAVIGTVASVPAELDSSVALRLEASARMLGALLGEVD